VSVRVKVTLRDGVVDEWGDVIDMSYSGGSEVLHVRHNDGGGGFGVQKDYYCGHYTAVEIDATKPGDSSIHPADATKAP
jgi:hypothetical protein